MGDIEHDGVYQRRVAAPIYQQCLAALPIASLNAERFLAQAAGKKIGHLVDSASYELIESNGEKLELASKSGTCKPETLSDLPWWPSSRRRGNASPLRGDVSLRHLRGRTSR